MNTKIKNILKTTITTLVAIFVVAGTVQAVGTLTPSGTAGDDTQYTTNNIYDKLTDFTATSTVGSGTMTIPSSVSATFNTLSEIYGLLEAEEADLVAGNIADGVEIFGVTGTKEDGVVYPTEWSADDPAGYVDWSTAVAYCDGLEEGGNTDWRLPTYIELVNAYLTSNPGNSLGFASDYYWSYTEVPDFTDFAYSVAMLGGNSNIDDRTSPISLARCTR